MPKATLHDPEFGPIAIRRSKQARHIKLAISQRGEVRISMPPRAPLFLAKTILAESRHQLRKHLSELLTNRVSLQHGDTIGKSHTLRVTYGDSFSSRLVGTHITVTLPFGCDATRPAAQAHIKAAAIKALRVQAKAYLTRRLQALAIKHGFTYNAVRFSNAGTRWGSCSSSGTISLNIWLMQLPFELIDYVLVHELAHTVYMNHSVHFWHLVLRCMPDYQKHKRALKAERPFL